MHLTARGHDCGLRDGHSGPHRTPAGVRQQRLAQHGWRRRKRATDPVYNEQERIRTRIRFRTYRYGITPQQRLALFEASDGLCALCYERPATTVDHDHETGQIRGALCNGCNSGLGNLGDSVEGLTQGLDYLRTVPDSLLG